MPTKTSFSWPRFSTAPIVGILRGTPLQTVLPLAKAYQQAGFTTLEVTMNSPGAAETIAQLKSDFPNLNIGAGTVCNRGDLEKALTAGAQFIVTPILDETVIKISVDQNIPIFPGAYTPSEIYKAWSLGASAVKVFPATQLGPQYIKDILAPLNEIKLLPTGGIARDNILQFFEAGAFAVGMGSSLFEKRLIANSDYGGLMSHFTDIKNQIGKFIKT